MQCKDFTLKSQLGMNIMPITESKLAANRKTLTISVGVVCSGLNNRLLCLWQKRIHTISTI